MNHLSLSGAFISNSQKKTPNHHDYAIIGYVHQILAQPYLGTPYTLVQIDHVPI